MGISRETAQLVRFKKVTIVCIMQRARAKGGRANKTTGRGRSISRNVQAQREEERTATASAPKGDCVMFKDRHEERVRHVFGP